MVKVDMNEAAYALILVVIGFYTGVFFAVEVLHPPPFRPCYVEEVVR